MIAPRDIYELADTVEAELLAQDGADLEQVEENLWYSWLFVRKRCKNWRARVWPPILHYSRWHWKARGQRRTSAPHEWSTSGGNFSSSSSSAPSYSGLLSPTFCQFFTAHSTESRPLRRRKMRDWSRWQEKDFSQTTSFGSVRLLLLTFTTLWMRSSGKLCLTHHWCCFWQLA